MAMTKQEWSVNALATEFNLDRRTVAKRINGIAPSGTKGGSPVWSLADVAPALAGHSEAAAAKPAPPVPSGFERLAGLPAIDQIATFAMLQMAYRIPAQVASLAVGSGASCETAFALYRAAQLAAVQMVADVASVCAIAPLAGNPDADLFDIDAFDGCDWDKLAAGARETVDLDAWHDAAIKRFAAE